MCVTSDIGHTGLCALQQRTALESMEPNKNFKKIIILVSFFFFFFFWKD